MAAITPDDRQELVALYLTMFGAAPTMQKLLELVVARENGQTLAQVATTLSTDARFALVQSKDAEAFAAYVADALLASDIPASARDWSINWIVTQVQGTKTKAQIVSEAVQAIRATASPNYASSRKELSADVTAALEHINNPSPSPSLSNAERTNIIKLVVGLFNAAPGATFLADLMVAYEANGYDMRQLAINLSNTPAYKAMNPDSQTVSEFCTALLTPLGLQNNQTAVGLVTAELNAGFSKGEIAYRALALLDARTDSAFADAKAILNNKTTVAEYYSVTLAVAQTNMGTLQLAIANVTANAASVELVKEQLLYLTPAQMANTTTYFDGVLSQLTAGADTYNGTNGANNVAGLAGDDVLHGGRGRDQLVGGEGNDTLYAGTYATSRTVTNDIVETYSDGMTVVVGTEQVTTYVFDDVFSEWLYGGLGNDSLYGGYGSDSLDGGDGNDRLEGDYMTTLAVAPTAEERKTMFNDTLVGGEGADTIVGGKGLDTIDLRELVSAKDSVLLEPLATATAMDADTITGFVSGTDTLTIDSAVFSGNAVLTIGTQIAAGATVEASIAAITAAANTYAMAYYIKNANGLSLAQIESAVTAGSAATGETYFFIDTGVDTLVYFDRLAQVDNGAGAGMVLLATLVGVTGPTALKTGDVLEV